MDVKTDEKATLDRLDRYIEARTSDSGFGWLDRWAAMESIDQKQAREYARELHAHNMLYHIDDDAADILWDAAPEPMTVPPLVCRKLDAISGKIRDKAREAFFSEAVKIMKGGSRGAGR